MTASLCLNADLGELPGPEGRALDSAMMRVITRCNIACGGHAGDAETMRATVRLAKQYGVQIGAHPSYPDRENFGRRSLVMDRQVLVASLLEQTMQLIAIARGEGAEVRHLKAHGALYNDAAKDPDLAAAIAGAARHVGIGELVGPPGSALEAAAIDAGRLFLAEGFSDRSYEADGSLTPRDISGAVLSNTPAILEQALRFAFQREVAVRGGGSIRLPINTLCLHSDTPGAGAHARAVRLGLETAGVTVRA